MARGGPKRVVLQATSLAALSDGYVGKIIDADIRRIFEDINDRGTDMKVRELTITLKFKPDGYDGLSIDTATKVKLPNQVPPVTVCKLNTVVGGMIFNPDCGSNPDQMTTSDLAEGEIDE